jgi:CBS-domain-containing membrane protein
VIASSRDVRAATVRDAMTVDPATCREDEDIERAVSLMADRQVRRMPILDSSGRLSGIIAQADVATRVNRDTRTGEMVEAISDTSPVRR